MKTILVKDLMVPLSEYATVSEGATLYEAVLALEKAQEGFDQTRDRHRAVLITNAAGQVIGKVSQLDVLRGLEPKYQEMKEKDTFSRLGLSQTHIKAMMEQFSLWDKPLTDICAKASRIKVDRIMYRPTEGEYVEEEASLDKAIHQLIMGRHQSLLVVSKGMITGILRLTDVFREVCKTIKTCELPGTGH